MIKNTYEMGQQTRNELKDQSEKLSQKAAGKIEEEEHRKAELQWVEVEVPLSGYKKFQQRKKKMKY